MEYRHRFWLFAGDYQYPVGGMRDYVDSFEFLSDAVDRARTKKYEWFHIFDSEEKKVLYD